MTTRARAAAVLACLALAGCGTTSSGGGSGSDGAVGFALPVGPAEWDALAPAWLRDGVLHVGAQEVELGRDVDEFVLGMTGAYWTDSGTLMFTSTEGRTQEVADVGWGNIAVSADRTVFATVDQSRGPTDDHGTHVIQVVAFDTRTGEQLYRTPDEEPDDGADLAALYPEIMPLLRGVSADRLFFDDLTVHLDDGATVPADDADGFQGYEGYTDTVFPDGYHVGIRSEGTRRVLDESDASYAVARLSPDRSTVFDTSMWPTDAVVYDATTGRRADIHTPWPYFVLGGWSDEDTFYGVSQDLDLTDDSTDLRAEQLVTCELDTLDCTPVSPVVVGDERGGALRVEGSKDLL